MIEDIRGDQPKEALLRGLYELRGRIPLSFEVFPPKDADGRTRILETVDRLAPVADRGFSVTMGAGGATRSRTVDTATEIAQRTGHPVMAHLISQGLARDEALDTADELWERGIRHILALRGDRPKKGASPLPPGFDHASDLVTALRGRHDFEIAVAAHPEKHPEAATLDQDIDYLKQKLEAGAGSAYCQFVLDPAAYGRFLEVCAQRGINAPIIPGLMPIEKWPRVKRFALMNGASVPDWLNTLLAQIENTPQLEPYLAMAIMIEHARRLIAYGAPEMHVYTMNNWSLSLALAKVIGHT